MHRALFLGTMMTFATSAFAMGVDAKPCRDNHGRFMKCTAPIANHCRDAKTKRFAKCGAPNAVPVPGR
jgi:hypothetical protein